MRCIDEADELQPIGAPASRARGGSGHDKQSALDAIRNGVEVHDAVNFLTMIGVDKTEIVAAFNEAEWREDEPRRWRDRIGEIDRSIRGAERRKARHVAKTFSPPPVSDAPPEPPVQSLHTVSAASFAGKKIPKQQWLARDLIPAGQPCLLSGDGGLGKSLLALQLTVAVASDTSWLSRVVAKGGALYLSAEDELDEIHRRLAAICKHASLDLAKLTDLHIAPLAEVDALLAAPQAGRLAMTALYDALVRRVEELRPAVVVLDSLADVFGGNEIVRPEVRWFVGQLRGLCHRTGCTIVILAHPSLSGMASGSGLSGSTHWNNSVRSRLYLTRPDGEDDDPDERVLEVKKNNRGALGKRIDIRWQRGVFVACDGGDAKAFTDADVDALFLEILARYAEEGRYVNAAAGASYAPTVFAREEEAAAKHVKKKALAAAMRRLFKAKRIVVQTRRVSGHDRSFIALAGGSPQ